MEYEVRTFASIRALGEADYRSLESRDTPPFSSFDWLDALEITGCAARERGWIPMHVALYRDGGIVACAPAYVKTNSEGEFVFDYAWARYCEGSLGRSYYPKLVFAVPFTPATGPRLLVKPGESREALYPVFAEAVRKLTEELELSSAHVLFPSEPEVKALANQGLAHRVGVQFHWRNAGYGDFDDFLGRFNSKRRNQIRRERREVRDQGVELKVHTGADLTAELVDFVFTIYKSTVDKFMWGRRYLKREFFEEVIARIPERLHVMVASDRASGKRIAGAFNILGQDALYGRYWGTLEDRPFLHFEVCFYSGIEDAIRRGLRRFEPGAGGEHKMARGFEPSLTHSAHHLRDRRLDQAVREFLAREEASVRAQVDEACAEMGMKPRH